LEDTLKRYNISPEERQRILAHQNVYDRVSELLQIYRFQYQHVLSQLGTCIDFDTFFSSHQSENHRFTQWTLRRLNNSGLIIRTLAQRPYCSKCRDIKAIEKDLSEVTAKGKVDWDNLRVTDGQVIGGEFACRLHSDTPITVCTREEMAIDYSNPEVQDRTINLLEGMSVWPEKHRSDIPGIIRSRKAKPFERDSQETIGAQSPFNQNKKVEALADSNIYMEFFAVARMINRGQMKLENLTDELFDFVFLNRGDLEGVAVASRLPIETVRMLKSEVNEIYPIDLSVIGFEHKEVHLPFSLFTHAAVLPTSFFFREYLITGHITRNGEKMSKSKGNVVYLDDIIRTIQEKGRVEGVSEQASIDSLRYFLAYYQYLEKDFDWDDNTFFSVGVNGARRFVRNILDAEHQREQMPIAHNFEQIDKWLSTVHQRAIKDYITFMSQRNHRDAMITIGDNMGRSLKDYLHNGGQDQTLVREYVSSQLRMMNPVMPRISTELFVRLFRGKIVDFPKYSSNGVFPNDYERQQHAFIGPDYVKSQDRIIGNQIGKLLGQKKVSLGGNVRIILPSDYHAGIVGQLPTSTFKGVVPSYSVDYNLKEILIEC
jgi:leucyl-tRNA synthetase